MGRNSVTPWMIPRNIALKNDKWILSLIGLADDAAISIYDLTIYVNTISVFLQVFVCPAVSCSRDPGAE